MRKIETIMQQDGWDVRRAGSYVLRLRGGDAITIEREGRRWAVVMDLNCGEQMHIAECATLEAALEEASQHIPDGIADVLMPWEVMPDGEAGAMVPYRRGKVVSLVARGYAIPAWAAAGLAAGHLEDQTSHNDEAVTVGRTDRREALVIGPGGANGYRYSIIGAEAGELASCHSAVVARAILRAVWE